MVTIGGGNIVESISTRLKKAMSVRNMSQVDLVEKTKISKGALSSYISGRYLPKQNNIRLLAKALDISEAWLNGANVPMETSLTNIIQQRLQETKMTMVQLSERAKVSLQWLQHIDTFVPGEFNDNEIGYELITRVADALGVPGSILRTALARQEITVSDDPPQAAVQGEARKKNPYKPLVTDKTESLTNTEKDHIQKYRALDSHGKEMVDFTLQKEWERSTGNNLRENSVITIAEKGAVPDYLIPQAAHNDLELEPGEQEKMQEDLCNLKIPD